MNEISKSELAREMGISPSTVSKYLRDGMPVLENGKLDKDAALKWIKANVHHQQDSRGVGVRAAVRLSVDVDPAVDGEIDISKEAARLTKLRADKLELDVERMRGGTEEERRLKAIETTIAHLWWVFQRHSPHATTGLFMQEGYLNLKDGASCARVSSLLAARDSAIMRQMASVIEAAFADGLAPTSGRRENLLPWQREQIEWAKEVSELFQAEIDDRALLRKEQTND